ncbi:MAG TPA: EF-hand domain-containing protein [Blastocatellia bacterium]|nr:EF-hand domain-containing protein [Blastocatellia bacterium]
MKRFAICTIVIFLAVSTFTTAFAQTGRIRRQLRRQQKLDRAFQRLDRNNDGRITRDEWTRRPKAFDRFDLNRDGAITRDEFEQVRRRR